MDLDRGVLARIDRKLLAGLGQDETYRMVRVPVTAAKWSTWRRYCESAGVSMGRAIAAMIDRELVNMFGDQPGDHLPAKFLNDEEMAAFMHHAEIEPDPLRKLCVLLLARTGMRVGELCNLSANPVVAGGDNHWLHVPVGKLRNDRYVPLHPTLVTLIDDWRQANAVHIARTGRLLTDATSNVDRHRVTRMVRRIARNAGVGHVHPHQLRHTLATQAINRGMRLEAVAALLGHKNLEMTMVYARIADDTVANEYFDVAAQVDQLYTHRRTQGASMTFDPEAATPIEPTRAEAIVLFDWLHRHEDANTTPGDAVEQRALWNLNAVLERTLVEPFQSDYNDIVQAARTHLTDDSSPS